jgi:hypothetical protein
LFHHELEVVQRWWSLPVGCPLPADDGATYILLFAGFPGGAAGPDVRDAVFAVTYRPLLSVVRPLRLALPQVVGDVEFHVRSADWIAHGHHDDARYNNVVLHVVFSPDSKRRTIRQDGVGVPVCCLHDVVMPGGWPLPPPVPLRGNWPCHNVMSDLNSDEIAHVLSQAGQLRFEQKTHTFVEDMHTRQSLPTNSPFSVYDQSLIIALAEGLGYGRDRAFFRAVGLSLLHQQSAQSVQTLPEPLGRACYPAPLDAHRLRGLGRLADSWRLVGVWRTFHSLLLLYAQQTDSEWLEAIRAVFCDAKISLARADILIINVVLPFAAAVGLIERDTFLYELALRLYLAHPGLSENRVIRLMCQQLHLSALPQGSCQQQGLQHIYQQTCREKRCEHCILGKREI